MKISIITVNLNNRFGLEQTIKSVIAQNLDTLEHIVIDGKSTDGSLDVLKAYSNVKTFWLSEKDTGIYNAMNKGINIATGDYVLFLNSGDTFSGDTIIKQAITLINNEDLIYGNIIYNDLNKSWVKTFPDKLTFEYFIHNYLPHPATFIKRSLFKDIGLYNECNLIVSDWEFFNLAVNKFCCSYKHIPLNITNFSLDGISSKPEYADLIGKEIENSLKKNFSTFLVDYTELFRLRYEYDLLQKKYDLLKNSRLNRLRLSFKKIFHV